jgi:rod shape-determining protein MreD
MKWLLIVFFLPLQTLFFEWGRIGGVKPDLALIITTLFALSAGPVAGLFLGVALGGLNDLASIGTLGTDCLFKGGVGLVCGQGGKILRNRALWVGPVVFLVVSLAHDHIGNFLLYDLPPTGAWLQDEVTRRALYGSLITLLLATVSAPELIDDARPPFSARQESGT